jgi:6-pyruvoyltetrahydropterin/6-carboxytetrahydropterin synthase
MSRLASVVIHESELSFSAGHITNFSETEREQMHGHNYHVKATFDVLIKDNGLSFDYRHYKRKLKSLCDQLDRYFLLPEFSPYMPIEDQDEYWLAHFNKKKLLFLKDDVVILPVTNITIEELSHWFLDQLIRQADNISEHGIKAITLHVYNGPGQSGGASWHRE